MTNYYTNVQRHKNDILLRGWDNGKRVHEKIRYKPYVFVPTNDPTPFRTIDKENIQYLQRIQFNDMYEAGKFLKELDEVENANIYGLTRWVYPYINDEYPGKVDFNPDEIRVGSLDIEVDSKDGFPDPIKAEKQITAITVTMRDKATTFGYLPYNPKSGKVKYIQCRSEQHLIDEFLEFWERIDLDIVTGWNTDIFDIPYLYNRICKLFDEAVAGMLSPWGIVEQKQIVRGKTSENSNQDRTEIVYIIHGITSLDYMQLYKKFSGKTHENYKLDTIAMAVLKVPKLDYSEYKSLTELYEKNPEKFYDYNIHDAFLVENMDAKLGFIRLVLTMAYKAKVNYSDTMTTVTQWDVLIANRLWEDGIIVSPQKENIRSQFVGGYVKEPQIGKHRWVVGLDLDSLYPRLIFQFNMGPETIRGRYAIEHSLQDLIDGKLDNRTLCDDNLCLTSNLYTYTKEYPSYIATIVDEIFTERIDNKRLMTEAKKRYEATKDPEDERLRSLYYNIQYAAKIFMNSLYGAMSNVWFRWFDIRIAEGITTTGQHVLNILIRELNNFLNYYLGTNRVDYIIAGDTDSVYIVLDKIVERQFHSGGTNDEILDFIDKFVQENLQVVINKTLKDFATYMNAPRNVMNMKRESIADTGVWTAAKHYALNVLDMEGVRLKEPELKLTGIEAVRSSTPTIVREQIKKSFKIIMSGTEEEFQQDVAVFKENFMKRKFEEVAFPRGINGMQQYYNPNTIYGKGTPIQVRGALMYNHYIKELGLEHKYPPIQDKDKIRFCYLKEPNELGENVIAVPDEMPPEFELEQYIDYKMQYAKSFEEPMVKILNIIGWNIEPINTLEYEE